ncbi:hypothetical protein IFR10_10035 [Bacillus sp. CFBP 13597]|nr:hypothetical protein [Bacillus sp. CFBP 13597]
MSDKFESLIDIHENTCDNPVNSPFTREFRQFTREFEPFTREFGLFTREFALFTREFD